MGIFASLKWTHPLITILMFILKAKNLALGFKVILVEIRKPSMMKTLIAKPS